MFPLPFSAPINLIAVFAAAAASMVIGSIWYAEWAFGKLWMDLSGMTPAKARQGAGLAIATSFLSMLITAMVLAAFLRLFEAYTFVDAFKVGIALWLGFIASFKLMHFLFDARPFALFVLYAAYDLVTILAMSIILTMWR